MQAVATHSRAEHPARIVAMALAFYAERQSNLAWPSDETLVGWAKVSRSQLYRSLKSLEGAREIQRQPRVPGGPRRVYLIDPMRASQLPLFEANVPPLAPSSPQAERVTRENERSTRGRGEGTTRTVNPTPPAPQGGSTGLTPSRQEQQPGPTPLTAPGQRVAPARRRRERRRRMALPSSVPCPLDSAAVSAETDPAALHEAWRALCGQLRGHVRDWGEWEMWTFGAHLHHAADALELALAPHALSRVEKRWGALLEEVAQRPVLYVPCTAAGEGVGG